MYLAPSIFGGGSGSNALPALDSNDVIAVFRDGISGATVTNYGTGGASGDLTANETINHGGGGVDSVMIPTALANGVSTATQHYETGTSPPVPTASTGFTISGWFKQMGSRESNDRMILRQVNTTWTGAPDPDPATHPPTGSLYDFIISLGANDFSSAINGGSGEAHSVSIAYIDDRFPNTSDEWFFAGTTINSGQTTMSLYLNGELVDSTAMSFTVDFSSNTGPWVFGNRVGSSEQRFDGHMFDVRVADVERDAAWFKDQYQSIRGLIG